MICMQEKTVLRRTENRVTESSAHAGISAGGLKGLLNELTQRGEEHHARIQV